MTDVTHHADPRGRRRHEHGAPPVDALAAAVRLDLAADAMRARQLAGGPEPLDDEPPTGLLDLAAIRAAVGAAEAGEDVDPAAAAWLAGGADPAAVRVVDQVDQLDQHRPLDNPGPGDEPWHCQVCGGPCREAHDDDQADEQLDQLEHRCPECGGVGVWGVRECDCTDAQPAVVESAAPTSAAPVVVTPPSPPTPSPPTPAPPPVPAPRVFSSERDPRPGWASRHDPRSRAFALHARLGAAPLQDVDLPVGPVLDQGQEGECVGCGLVDATNVMRLIDPSAGPMLRIADAAALYHRAQQLDDVPGEQYVGTSVLAGMKAAAEVGWIGGYLWAFGTREIASALAHGRPVVIGIPWLSGMYDTGPGGLVAVAGEDRGEGHCLAVVKLRMTGPQGQPGPYFGWLNSWGKSYGDQGIGWVHHRDLAGLLAGAGEAAVPTLDAQAPR